jgi:hypothetical protein
MLKRGSLSYPFVIRHLMAAILSKGTMGVLERERIFLSTAQCASRVKNACI